MLKKFTNIVILSIFFIMLFGINSVVNADMGPKPSITIYLKNMETTNYIIDLFQKDVLEENKEILEADYRRNFSRRCRNFI